MRQMTLPGAKGFEGHGRASRKAEFLARMEALVPWAEFYALIEPHYPKAGGGRPPRGIERMLRMKCIAMWFNLGDEACEAALYDNAAFRDSCGIDLGRQRVPDATTLVNQRKQLEDIAPGAKDFTNKRAYRSRSLTEADKETNRRKSSVRSKVEHPFLTLKCIWGFAKVRYRGLAKNAFAMLALINLSKWGRPFTGQVRPA